MNRNRIRILVVDDDATQGKALNEAFQRAGFQSTWCSSSVQAITTAQRQEFDCLFVDCVLPKMNGMDLVEELTKMSLSKPKVFMFSGIFRDRAFVKETLAKTQAINFFLKPLNLEEAIAAIDEVFKNEAPKDDPALVKLYREKTLPGAEIAKIFEEESPLSDFHLPLIYRRLQQAGVSGELLINSVQGETYNVNFYKGNIFYVLTPDKDSYFGALAINLGFVSSEDVVVALNSPGEKRLGQKLVESFSLSPHAVHVIMEEQLALRLSQTIQNSKVTLKWTPKKFGIPDLAINYLRFESLVCEWATSKVDGPWIRENLMPWSGYALEGSYHPEIQDANSIHDLLNRTSFNEDIDLPFLYRQLMHGNVHLGELSGESDPSEYLQHRLEKLLEDHKTQNFFEVLGLNDKAQTAEIKRSFQRLKELFDPQSLPAATSPAVLIKCTRVFQHIELAYNTLSDDSQRAAYVKGIVKKQKHQEIESEAVFRSAVTELLAGQAEAAAEKFQKLIDSKLSFKDLRAYRIWAGLLLDRNFSSVSFDMITPEERHSAPYLMAKGVQHRARGQNQKALESFRSALTIDPRLRDAIEAMGFQEETRTFMGGIFGKPGGRRGA